MVEDKSTKTNEQANNGSVGCVVLLVIIPLLLLIFGVIIGLQVAEDEVWLVPGDPNNFDPIANYAAVAEYAGENAQLTRIEAHFVKSDGTLNLNAGYDPAPRVIYQFFRATRDNNAPVGAAAANAIWHRQVNITISQPYKWTFATQGAAGEGVGFDLNLGMDRDRYTEVLQVPPPAIPIPTCSFRDFWVDAIEGSNADVNAVATIIYDQSGYTFLIQGTDIALRFSHACE